MKEVKLISKGIRKNEHEKTTKVTDIIIQSLLFRVTCGYLLYFFIFFFFFLKHATGERNKTNKKKKKKKSTRNENTSKVRATTNYKNKINSTTAHHLCMCN